MDNIVYIGPKQNERSELPELPSLEEAMERYQRARAACAEPIPSVDLGYEAKVAAKLAHARAQLNATPATEDILARAEQLRRQAVEVETTSPAVDALLQTVTAVLPGAAAMAARVVDAEIERVRTETRDRSAWHSVGRSLVEILPGIVKPFLR